MTKKDTSIINFVIGTILFVTGVICIFRHTSVQVYWARGLYGSGLPGGVVTLPIIAGIALMFVKPGKIAWILLVAGTIALLVQIIMSVSIIFNTTSLLKYLWMFGGTFGGLALIVKAFLRPRG